MSATISISPETVAKLANLGVFNSVAIASIEFYEAALAAAGIDPETLSFREAVEVTRRLYADSADYRRDRAEVAKVEREKAAKAAKAKRDAEKAKRVAEEIAKAEAKLAALRGNG